MSLPAITENECSCGCGIKIKVGNKWVLGHNTRKQPARGFKAGHTMGQGRPKGSRNRSTIMALQLIEGQSKQLAQVAIDMALSGNYQALALCLERLIPKRKSLPLEIELTPAEALTVDDLSKQSQSLVAAVCSGVVSPEDAHSLSQVLSAHSRNLQLSELSQKITALEHQLDQRGLR